MLKTDPNILEENMTIWSNNNSAIKAKATEKTILQIYNIS